MPPHILKVDSNSLTNPYRPYWNCAGAYPRSGSVFRWHWANVRLLRVVRGYVDIDGEALPAVPHLIPLAAWISGVGAGLSLSGTVAALSACSIRRRGKSLGAGDDD